MDSTGVEIFGYAFSSGAELGSNIVAGMALVAVLVVTAKLIRSI